MEWVDINLSNSTATLLLHGTTTNNYQILSTTNADLLTNQQALILGRILTNTTSTTDPLAISNVSLSTPGTNYYLAHGATNILSLFVSTESGVAFAPSDTNGTGLEESDFIITRNNSSITPLTVFYTISGTASNGVDYASVTNFVTFGAFSTTVPVPIVPLFNTNYPDFSKTVFITLLEADNYLI